MKASALLAVSYKDAFKSAVVQQILVLALTAGVLDGGTMFDLCAYAALGFWAGAILMRFRRPVPSKADLLFLQMGYIPLCFLSYGVCGFSHHWDF